MFIQTFLGERTATNSIVLKFQYKNSLGAAQQKSFFHSHGTVEWSTVGIQVFKEKFERARISSQILYPD